MTKTIIINNYLHPKGLEVDLHRNIWLCAFDANAAIDKQFQKSKFLFNINEHGHCLHKINVGVAFFASIIFFTDKILFSCPYKETPLCLVEFE